MTDNQRRVGRPRKYANEDERKEAKAEQNRDYIARNREKRNKRLRDNYQERMAVSTQFELIANVENVEQLDIGDLQQKCSYCNGLSFKNEQGRSKHSCCHGGKLQLTEGNSYPELLKNLLFGRDETSQHFRSHIRVYNNAFAFASFNSCNEDIAGKGPYCMRIVGDTSRKATTSLLSNGSPRYGQVYIFDDNETVKYRIQHNLREDLLSAIHDVMKINPYAKKYKELYNVYKETGEETVTLNFVTFQSDDIRRYNAPTCNSVAAVIATHDGSIPQSVEVKVFPRNDKECDFINSTSHHCDPMLFPLLFPSGEHGWSYMMKTANMKNISPLQYYSYKLTVREGQFNPIFVCGRLTQQYIINCYLTVEAQRLKYLRLNQSHLRSECYQGIVDHVRNYEANNADTTRLGNFLVLPSTYQGSARSMQQLYQDAMAISRKVGRPDLFITITCNPKWPEITRYLQSLPQGITANDIPHFTTRLFYQKCLKLISDLHKVFGEIRAYVYTIEFQKRGLPHMHLLVTLQNKLLTADDVDRYICAEIPNKETLPSLWYKVTRHMLHGPHSPGTPCYDITSKSCKKNFPKDFIDETNMSNTGFPKYRRRNNMDQMHTYHGKHNGKIVQVDNSMVVPYNPYLLMKYNCHINVEYCASIMGIKYIHKYIHKGHDKARLRVGKGNSENGALNVKDEIQEFVDTRYLSATECAWRLFELPLHGRSHTVERLPIHLPGMNRVMFEEGRETAAIDANRNTKLTAYFQLNKECPLARGIRYEDIPSSYRWINDKKIWQKRVYCNSKTISRLIAVSPKSVELFHLKLILRNVSGATDFDELRTVNGTKYTTFREAATAFGLIASDTEIIDVMTEASSTLMPCELRHFFVYILIGCESVNASDLWSKFKKYLSEDSNENHALNVINQILEKENSSLKNFGMTTPSIETEAAIDDINYTFHRAEYEKMVKTMNPEQYDAFDNIAKAINKCSSNNCFYIDGPGGSGKTYVYRCVIHYALSIRKKIFTIAWTGIAAILLPFGRTAHKTFQLPINLEEKSTLYWNKKTKKILMETDIFIWDEASMIPSVALESIEIALRDICSSTAPFGGKIVLLGGDFRQVLPVVKRAGKSQIINSTIKRCSLWSLFTCFQLNTNMRAFQCESAAMFSNWLLEIGNGITQTLYVTDAQFSSDVVNEMYCDKNSNLFLTQAILTPRNDDVAVINRKILKVLPGEMYDCMGVDYVTTRGTDTADEATELFYPLEYINSLTPSGFPPYCLSIKNGAIVMLIRNICVADGLCNGTRLIVRNIKPRILCCEILTGDKKGNSVYIPRITLESSADTDLPFILHRTQFPVRVAFAMTINKSQGQSFERIGLYLMDNHPIFTHGQLYVALSRCQSYDGIKIQLSRENVKREIQNIVYTDVLE